MKKNNTGIKNVFESQSMQIPNLLSFCPSDTGILIMEGTADYLNFPALHITETLKPEG